MSVRLVGLLVAGLLSCTPVMAGNFVIGGSIGIATGGEDVASLNEQLEDAGFTATASTSGDIRTSWKASVGYHLNSINCFFLTVAFYAPVKRRSSHLCKAFFNGGQ